MKEPTLSADDVDGLRGLPRRVPQLSGDNDFTGTNTFERAVTLNNGAVGSNGAAVIFDVVKGGQIGAKGTVVPTAAPGAAAGTGGTAAMLNGRISSVHYQSLDAIGTLRVVVGTSPSGNAVLATVTFGDGVITSPTSRMILVPADAPTALVHFANAIFAAGLIDGSGWTANVAGASLPPGPYTWHCIRFN